MTVQERLPEPSNPLGIDGLEFIEFATSQPQALGAVVQKMDFERLAGHRTPYKDLSKTQPTIPNKSEELWTLLALPGKAGDQRGEAAAPRFGPGAERRLGEVKSLFPRIEQTADKA